MSPDIVFQNLIKFLLIKKVNFLYHLSEFNFLLLEHQIR